jgi:hypothetical protein
MSKRSRKRNDEPGADPSFEDVILGLATAGDPTAAATGRFYATGAMQQIRDFVLAEEDLGRVDSAHVYMVVLASVARLFGERIGMQLESKQGKLPGKLAAVMGQCVAVAALQALRARAGK